MVKLLWDQTGERLFETGVSKGVLYLPTNGIYDFGVVWNGLTTVTESPTGAEATPQYADNMKYLNLVSAEDFGCTIEAFTYPREFAQCDGSGLAVPGLSVGQQARRTFGFSYQNKVGNDLNPDLGYKIHLVYGALAAPSEKANATVNESPEAAGLSWEVTTTPVAITAIDPATGKAFKPSAHLVIDSTVVNATALATLEDILYGTAGVNARLPLPDEVIAIFAGSVTTATPTTPTFVAAGGTITIPVVTGVTYRRTDTNAVVTGTVVIPTVGGTLVIRATPNPGYKFAANVDDDWMFTRTS